ncbi:discoidin domain-containing protein [Phytoactinopolyspora halophila]|nr:discoidin domain-containing protein [Phytoactinopolyspora halophila]
MVTVPTAAVTVGAQAPAGQVAADHVVTIDGGDSGRAFDGVGGVSAGASSRLLVDYPEQERDEILDYLFAPAYGAALDVLKVEIGGDIDSTAGAEASHMRSPDEVDCSRGYEWWLMAEAQERNPDIAFYGLPWGAPGWFEEYWSADRIDYLMSWMDCAKQHGFEIDYLGAANESGADRDSYVNLRNALDANGYSDTDVVASDNHAPPDYWFVADQMQDDPEFADAVDVLGEHDVCVWRTEQRTCHVSEAALALDKPLWDSENSTQDYVVGAQPLARAMNRHYIDAQVTGNLNWALLGAWYDNFPIGGTGLMLADRPWSGYYEVGPSIWVDAHTTQFTDPGWRYLDGASDYTPAGASYVSLRSPETDDYTVVIETLDSTTAETLTFDVTGGLSTDPVHVWSTDLETASTEDDFIDQESVDVHDGSFDVTVEPGHVYTLSTTAGQAKGSAQSSADPGEQLQVPYTEDFDDVDTGGLAPYFSDVHGGFEAVPCAGDREGTCYQQMVTQEPMSWHGHSMSPTTMVGDPRWWGNYEVGVDARMLDAGYVELAGRVDSQQHAVAGYHVQVTHDGEWRLYSQDVQGEDTELASGETAPPGTNSWHRLGLRFRGETVTALLDGEELATVEDASHTTGQVGLRVSGWNRAQFDDLRVTPNGPAPRFVPHSQMTATATSEHAGNDAGHTYTVDEAIDDRLWSEWRSEYAPPAPLPQSITLDLGRTRQVHGVAYTPPVTRAPGLITSYEVYTSQDGHDFAQVASGRWDETRATKTAPFSEPVKARYVRLQATEATGCPQPATVTELNVATTPLAELGADGSGDGPAPEFPAVVPRAEMSASATSQQPGYEADKAIDGDCQTMWHQSFDPYEAPPQSITFDLGDTYDTSGLVYEPRQDGNRNGMITDYEISVSSDGETFTEVQAGQWAADDTTKYAEWSATAARYVRLHALEGFNGHVSAAEVGIAHTSE